MRDVVNKLKYFAATLLFLLTSSTLSIGPAVLAGRAFANPNAPTSPLYYTGQGLPLNEQCDANNTPYLLFIFTYGGGSPTNVALHGISVTSQDEMGNETHFTTPYQDPTSLENVVNVTWDGTVGNGAQLVISHGCSGGQTGTITVTKMVNNYHGGTAVASDFPLYVDSAQVTSGTTNTYAAGQSYTVSEDQTAVPGYTQTDLTCSDAAGTLASATFTLAAGENVSCTITNEDVAPTLTLIKKVSGGTAAPSDWTLTATGPTTISGVSGSSTVTGATVSAGTYVLSESGGPSGYTAGAWSCDNGTLVGSSLTLPLATDATCTIVNTRDTGTVTVNKVIDPSTDTGLFNLIISGPTDFTATNQGNGGTTGVQTVDTGTYTVSETAGTGTSLSDYSSAYACYDGNTVVASGTATVSASFTVATGQDVVCTFTNTKYSSISGTKWETNSDSTHIGATGLSGWTIELFDSNNKLIGTQTTGSDGSYSFTNLLGGTSYTLLEVLQSGWTQIVHPGTVNLAVGQNSAGNDFGNFKNATIKGYKWNDENGDGKHQKSEPKLAGWTIDLYDSAGVQIGTTTTDSNGNYSFSDIAPGTYKVCEVLQSGWIQTYPATKDGCHSLTVQKSGHTYTENFGNQGHGTITVSKYLYPNNDSGKFNLDVDGQTKAANVGNSGTTGSVDVVAGTHNVSELAGTGTSLSDYDSTYDCWNSNGDWITSGSTTSSDNFEVSAGETVNCTFENFRHASLTIVKKAYPFGTSQAFTFDVSSVNFEDEVQSLGTSTLINSFQLDDNNDPTLPNAKAMSLAAGTYTVTEEATAGWNLVGIDCGNAQVTTSGATVTVNLDFGQQVTCTYTNQQPVVPQVLGASTTTGGKGAVLANTGTSVVVPTILAVSLTLTAAGVMVGERMQRKSATSDPTL